MAAGLGIKPPSRDQELPKGPEEQEATQSPRGTWVSPGGLDSSFCSTAVAGNIEQPFLFDQDKYQ